MGEFSGGIGSVIICFVPRILTGVVPHYIYKLVKKCSKSTGVSKIGLILAGVGGSLTNTLLVMNLIYLFFKDTYAAANGVAVKAFMDLFCRSSESTEFRRRLLQECSRH